MDKLLELGRKYNIPVIEDSAEAIGSFWKGKHAGTMGSFGTFSFHGTKTITTGEGGMFITSDDALYERVLTLSNHGRAKQQKKMFWPDEIGFKYKMSNIQAAIGCGQLERISELVQRKREIFHYYSEELRKFEGVKMNPEYPGTINGYWMPTVVFDAGLNVSHESLLAAFRQENIDARVFFYPLSSLPMFDDQRNNILSWDLPNRSMNLPSYHDLSLIDQARIIQVITKLVEK